MAKKVSVVVDIQAQASSINQQIQQVQSNLGKLKMNPKVTEDLLRAFGQIGRQISQISATASTGFTNPAQMKKAQDDLQKLSYRYEDLISQIRGYSSTVDIKDLLGEDKEYNEILTNLEKVKKKIKDAISAAKGKGSGKQQDSVAPIFNQLGSGEIDSKTAKAQLKEAEKAAQKENSNKYKSDNIKAGQMAKKYGAQDIASVDMSKVSKGDSKIISDLQKQRAAYLETRKSIEEYYKAQREAVTEIDKNITKSVQLTAEKEGKEKPAIQAADMALKEVINTQDQVSQATASASSAIDANTEAMNKQSTAAKNIGQLKSYIGYMFSMTTVLMKTRQAIGAAIDNFKQLDKQFNEISIVTGKSMDELWSSFKTVNSTAQEYGVTASNVVSVQKLYYQQGRKTSEVNKLVGETITFAKISGLEFADATDKMTAAINAYKIEAEDANKVTDSYAALSMNAAVNAEELATAMSKTASIAALSGAEFEDTSAYLAKIIETTREAPETAGTALKTVIARFTEVSKLTEDQAELLDEDYNFNNIEKALKTVGISTKDSAGQLRSFSDIIGELGPMWDSLSSNQQHYIATQAAGSRQQSRFIALMDDWARTEELMETANNSAGTGARQLALSMDSIDSSINKIKSSWEAFYTQLVTGDQVKDALDIGVVLMEWANEAGPFWSVVFVGAGYALISSLTKAIKTGGAGLGAAITDLVRTAMRRGTENFQTKTKTGQKLSGAAQNQRLKATKLKEKREGRMAFDDKDFSKRYKNLQKKIKPLDFGLDKNEKQFGKIIGFQSGLGKSIATNTSLTTALNAAKATGNKLDDVQLNNLGQIIASKATENGIDVSSASTDSLNNVLKSMGIELSEEELQNLNQIVAMKYADTAATGAEIAGDMSDVAATAAVISSQEAEKASLGSLIAEKWASVTVNLAHLASDPFTWGLAIAAVAAIGIVTAAVGHQVAQKNKDIAANKALAESTDKYTESLKSYKSLLQNIEKYKKLKNKPILTAEEEEELLEVTEELAEEYPALIKYRDLEGNAILKETDELDKLVEKKKEELELDRQRMMEAKKRGVQAGAYDESTTAGQKMEALTSVSKSYGEAKEGSIYYDKISEWATGNVATKKGIQDALSGLSEEGAVFDERVVEKLTGEWISKSEWQDFIDAMRENPNNIEKNLQEKLNLNFSQISTLTDMNSEFGNALFEMFQSIPNAFKDVEIQEGYLRIEEAEIEYGYQLNDEFKRVLAGLGLENLNTENSAKTRLFSHTELEYYEDNLRISANTPNEIMEAIVKSTSWEDFKNDDVYNGTTSSEYYSFTGEGFTEQDYIELKAVPEILENFKNLSNKNQKALNSSVTTGQSFSASELENIALEKMTTDKILSLFNMDPSSIESESLRNSISQALKSIIQGEQANVKEDIGKIQKVVGDSFNDIIYNMDPKQLKSFSKTLADVGEEGAKAFVNSYRGMLGQLEGNKELTTALYGIDFTNQEEINNFKTALIQAYGDSSEQVIAFNTLIANSGSILDKTGGTFADIKKQLVSDISTIQSKFEDLNSAIEGALGFEEMTKLVEESEGVLNYDMFSATGEGFKLSEANAKKYQKYLLDEQKAKAQSVIATKKLEIAEIKESIAVEVNRLAHLKNQLAITKDAKERKKLQDEIAEAEKDVEEKTLTLEEATKAYEDAENSIKLVTLAYQELNKAAQLDNVKKSIETMEEIISLISDIDIYENINSYLEYIDYEIERADFRIEFSTNVDEVVEATEQKMAWLIEAMNSSLAKADFAKKNAETAKKGLTENFSDIVSFDEHGNLIENTEAYAKMKEDAAKLTGAEKEAADARIQSYEALKDMYKTSRKEYQDATAAAEQYIKQQEELIDAQLEGIAALENKFLELLKEKDEKALESLEKRYEAMKEADEEYLDSVREMVEREREIREQNESAEDLTKQERKLQLLKMSGGSATEIQALEEEVAKKRQEMADKQIDQLLDEIERENEVRAADRDAEIAYNRSVLDAKLADMTWYNAEVARIMNMSKDEIMRTWMEMDNEYVTATGTNKLIMERSMGDMVTTAKSGMRAIGYDADGLPGLTDNYYSETGKQKGYLGEVDGKLQELKGSTELDTKAMEAYSGAVSGLSTAIKSTYGNDIVTGIGEVNSQYNGQYDIVKELISKYQTLINLQGQAADIETNTTVNDNEDTATTPTTQGYVQFGDYWYKEEDMLVNPYTGVIGVPKIGATRYESGAAGGYIAVMGTMGTENIENIPLTEYSDDQIDNSKARYIGFYDEYGKFKTQATLSLDDYSSGLTGNSIVGYKEVDVDGKIHHLYKLSTPIKDNATGNTTYWLNQTDLHQIMDQEGEKAISKRYNLYRYATGGIVDFTGPAWVDGTKTKPEAFLSADDTANIAALTNVLAHTIRTITPVQQTQSTGPVYYQIDINIEELGDGYSVDDLMDEVERRIIDTTKGQVIQVK